MEIKDFLLLMWRNVRYIILGLVVGAGIGFAITKIQVPVYEATTSVFVSRTRQQSNLDMLSLSDEQLLAINLQLAQSRPVLNEVISQLGDKISPNDIQVSAIPNTLIIQIKVQDTDPQRAATIANLLVQALIQQNETLQSERYLGFENALSAQIDQVQLQMDGLQTQISQVNDAGIQEQLTQVNGQIEQIKTEISTLEREIASFPDFLTSLERITLAEKQARLDQLHSLMALYQQIQANLTYIGKPATSGSGLEDPRLETLQSTLNLYRQMNVALINSRENVRLARAQSGQNVMQIVPATPPKNQERPIPTLNFLMGSAAGFILAAIAVLMMDHFDDSLKTAGQIEKLLGLPVLGFVLDSEHTKSGLITLKDPHSAEAGAFRALGARMEILGARKNIRTLMIVNAEPADARTTIAANVAVVNALQGKQIILLDGGLNHPHLHSLFGMENIKGVAELINDEMDINSARHSVKDVEGMTLIPAGLTQKDSTAWLDAKKLEQLLSQLRNQADLVIVDSPPADSADAQILASQVDAVLLVIKSGRTRADATQSTLRRLVALDAEVAGVVFLCNVPSRIMLKNFLPWAKTKPQERKDSYEEKNETEKVSISLT
jgi:capsular exopolysaccharide synthesis family protein